MRYGIKCTACGATAIIRTSRAVTDTFRQFICACTDPECGHTFGADLTITHTISPSAVRDPVIRLRTVPPRKRVDLPVALPVPANDETLSRGPEVPLAANDDCPVTEAM